jgi:exopolysaccharide biosynthesis WecB/TagA/CpsF family protein
MMTNNFSNIINIFSLPLLSCSFEEASNLIIKEALKDKKEPAIISHVNVHNYYHIERNPSLKDEIVKKNILFFDGIGLKISAFLLGHGWHPDLNGTDLFPKVMKQASEKGIRIFFLGSDEETIERTILKIEDQFPAIIAGYNSGFFSDEHEANIVDAVNKSKAHMLIIGRGFPLQEVFSLKCRKKLKVSVVWNVGGLFDFISENKPRAPYVLRKMRFEWLFRFSIEPARMFHRYFVLTPWLFHQILYEKFKNQKNMGQK